MKFGKSAADDEERTAAAKGKKILGIENRKYRRVYEGKGGLLKRKEGIIIVKTSVSCYNKEKKSGGITVKVETTRKTAKGLFVFYLIALAIRQLGGEGIGRRCISLIPFRMTGDVTALLAFGLLPAIPLGIFLRGLYKEQVVKRDIAYAALYGFVVQVAQYFAGSGIFDITGVIIAVAGAFLGIWIYDLARKKFDDETDHILTMLASIACGVIIAVFLGQLIIAFTIGMEGAL